MMVMSLMNHHDDDHHIDDDNDCIYIDHIRIWGWPMRTLCLSWEEENHSTQTSRTALSSGAEHWLDHFLDHFWLRWYILWFWWKPLNRSLTRCWSSFWLLIIILTGRSLEQVGQHIQFLPGPWGAGQASAFLENTQWIQWIQIDQVTLGMGSDNCWIPIHDGNAI